MSIAGACTLAAGTVVPSRIEDRRRTFAGTVNGVEEADDDEE
jgi:hypothetical protein